MTETLTSSSLAEVPLDDIIISETNKMFRDESDFSQDSLQELIDSIRENGLAQPILLRPNGKAGKYILVAGERRFQASKFIRAAIKTRTTIPAYIRELTDDQAFDLQLTENVQRKDVHPMREAKAYQFLQDKKKWSTAELALRFGKSETYVLQRLKLSTLIDEAAKDFTANYMTLGHAILIARLTPEDQKKVIDRCSETSGKKGSPVFYQTIHELEEFIQDNIVRDLKEASFDTEDANLVPKAGACATCAKRSGFSAQLFADVKEKDRCFDGACFNMKRNVAVFTKVKELVEKEPDVIFLEAYAYQKDEKINEKVSSFLAGQKIKILGHNDWSRDAQSWNNRMKKVNGFVLNGDQAGKKAVVYVEGGKSSAKVKGSSTPEETVDAKESINRIKERTKRAAELDAEKIYTKVLELLESNKAWMDDRKEEPTDTLLALLANIVYNHADYHVKEEIQKAFKIGRGNQQQEVAVFKKLSQADVAWMVRRIAVKQYSSPYSHKGSEGILIKELAPLYGVPVTEIEKEQADIREKREARAKERIAELQKTLKPAKKK